MRITTVFHSKRRNAASCLVGSLLCGLLAAPLTAIAEQPAMAAQKVHQQVVAIDARFKKQKPFLGRAVDGVAAEGAGVDAWGSPGDIEKISVEAFNERGRVFQDFYFHKNVLIAARERRIDYGAYIMELLKNRPTPMKVAEDDRLEFAGELVLRRRSFGRAMPKADSHAQDLVARLKTDAMSFKRLMDTPEPEAKKRGGCSWSCASNSRERTDECLVYKCD
jgi:hypothetical protein